MTYILMIFTIVAASDGALEPRSDWRPIGEFHTVQEVNRKISGLELCEAAARRLQLKTNSYQCVRSR